MNYDIYHASYTEAIQEVERFVEKNRLFLNPEELAQIVGLGNPRPREGQTNSFMLQLYNRDFSPAGKAIHVQMFGLRDQYELNMYISPLRKTDYHWYENEEKNMEKENIIELQGDIRLPNSNILLEKGDKIKVIPPMKESITRDIAKVTAILQRHFDKQVSSMGADLFRGGTPDASDYVFETGDGMIGLSAEDSESYLFASYYEEFGMDQINKDFEREMRKAGFSLEWEDPGTLLVYRG